ncbi:hypothetical protein [Streptomyces sp. MS191]|uniref:hypothetical protein n=1 Tax=Streptomyces sp. ms191 TaxID=1827978 RepID=UPI0021C9951B|nr:hypothetical protein [Streptomyces sp. ms191]
MSHEQMLAWVDEASSFYVQDAADRLTKAATKMREIAKTLRDRPGRVEWKGEAEKAFMEWADGLASSTHSLADYSDDASFWMSQASDAIALAVFGVRVKRRWSIFDGLGYCCHSLSRRPSDARREYCPSAERQDRTESRSSP